VPTSPAYAWIEADFTQATSVGVVGAAVIGGVMDCVTSVLIDGRFGDTCVSIAATTDGCTRTDACAAGGVDGAGSCLLDGRPTAALRSGNPRTGLTPVLNAEATAAHTQTYQVSAVISPHQSRAMQRVHSMPHRA